MEKAQQKLDFFDSLKAAVSTLVAAFLKILMEVPG